MFLEGLEPVAQMPPSRLSSASAAWCEDESRRGSRGGSDALIHVLAAIMVVSRPSCEN
jgi:hypothetical protein